jgi:hypothetical protein
MGSKCEQNTLIPMHLLHTEYFTQIFQEFSTACGSFPSMNILFSPVVSGLQTVLPFCSHYLTKTAITLWCPAQDQGKHAKGGADLIALHHKKENKRISCFEVRPMLNNVSSVMLGSK